MKRLMLLRHAKAESEPTEQDEARPLSPRGKRDATAMGAMMRQRHLVPELVLCSPSVRTRATLALIGPALGAPVIRIEDRLYLAGWKPLIALFQHLDPDCDCVLVIGHNPGLEDCAAALLGHEADSDERARRVRLAAKFPTCSLAVIDCPFDSWQQLDTATGRLSAFLRPKDLPGLR